MGRKNADSAEYFFFFWLAARVYKDIHNRWQPSKKRSINRIPNAPIHSNGNQRKWGERMRIQPSTFFFFWLAA